MLALSHLYNLLKKRGVGCSQMHVFVLELICSLCSRTTWLILIKVGRDEINRFPRDDILAKGLIRGYNGGNIMSQGALWHTSLSYQITTPTNRMHYKCWEEMLMCLLPFQSKILTRFCVVLDYVIFINFNAIFIDFRVFECKICINYVWFTYTHMRFAVIQTLIAFYATAVSIWGSVTRKTWTHIHYHLGDVCW